MTYDEIYSLKGFFEAVRFLKLKIIGLNKYWAIVDLSNMTDEVQVYKIPTSKCKFNLCNDSAEVWLDDCCFGVEAHHFTRYYDTDDYILLWLNKQEKPIHDMLERLHPELRLKEKVVKICHG